MPVKGRKATARTRQDVLVLCYHGISDSWPDVVAVGPQRLRDQLARLLRRGWQPATFTEAVLAPPAARTLAVTFDDGLRSVHALALPVLRDLGVVATAFVPAGLVDRGRPFAWAGTERWLGTPHEHELEGMSWHQLGELQAAGWEVGSHSSTHPRLTELDDERLARELRESKAEIERRLDAPCRSIAYPYSDVDDRVAAAARAAGYDAGAVVLPGHPAGDPLRFARVPIVATETQVGHRLHLTRVVRRLQATRGWPRVRRAAGIVTRAP
jgi:peptidoglycan/xylan/chitin deacetylase (PgdA/CDA1 family)